MRILIDCSHIDLVAKGETCALFLLRAVGHWRTFAWALGGRSRLLWDQRLLLILLLRNAKSFAAELRIVLVVAS